MTTTFDIDEIERLLAAATPGEWCTEYDPMDDGDHATAVCLPRKVGGIGTFLAYCQHNWGDAAYDERRISWKEATTNAALIVTLHNSAPAMIAELRELRAENARLKDALDEDGLAEIITDTLDIDWQPRWAAQAIRRATLGEPQ